MGTCSFRLISPPMKYCPQPQRSQLSTGEIAPFRLNSAQMKYPPQAVICASSTGGHRRFVPRQGALHPGPIPPMELVLENKLYSAVTPRNRGFRPKKAKKNPRESARVFPGIYSSAFPDALHPVWRPKDAGPEVTCYQLGGIFKHLRETVCFSRQAASAAGGVRGGTPSPVGTGAKPRRSPLW